MPWSERLKKEPKKAGRSAKKGILAHTRWLFSALRYELFFPAITALLIVLSWPKFDQGYFAWLALAPLTISIWKSRRLSAAVLSGCVAGALTYTGLLYWLYPTMRAGGVGPASALAGLALLSLVLSVEFIVISVFGFYLKKAGIKVYPYIFALGWAAMEYGKIALSAKFIWFPWFLLGYTQWRYPSLIQIASVTGVYGLSAAVCFSGALIGTLMVSKGKPWKKSLRSIPVFLLVGAIYYYGNYELKLAERSVATKFIDAALLQPNIDQYAKWDPAQAETIISNINGLFSDLQGAELVIWPENALPGWIDDPFYGNWLKKLSYASGAASVVGSVSMGDGKHVSAFLVEKDGMISASYDKRLLVPFGEYVPMRDILADHIGPLGEMGEFEPGRLAQPLFDFNGIKIGVTICYEAIFPYLFLKDAAAGAELFVNITNDGWYLDTAGPYQHFVSSVFRAVETRRTVVRAANTGISAVVDPWGRVIAVKGLGEAGVLHAKAPVYSDLARSWYADYGQWVMSGILLVVSAFLLAVILV